GHGRPVEQPQHEPLRGDDGRRPPARLRRGDRFTPSHARRGEGHGCRARDREPGARKVGGLRRGRGPPGRFRPRARGARGCGRRGRGGDGRRWRRDIQSHRSL
ncbi:MAG: Chlorohydrolase/deaminase family protein, partial [uncultured Rubrobacteraceae bacterium]